MKGLWSSENPLIQIYLKILEVIELSILWLIACLPVVTVGAATTALYYTAVKTLRNSRGYVARSFFSSFRENFRQSTLATVIWLLIMYIFYLDVVVLDFLRPDGFPAAEMKSIFHVMESLLTVFFLLSCFQIARFRNKLSMVLKNTVILGIRHIGTTVSVAFIVCCCAFAVWCIPLFAIGMPAVCAWLVSILLEKIYVLYMEPEDRAREEQWNLMKE